KGADFVQIQEAEGDLALKNAQIGFFFGGKRIGRKGRNLVAILLVELALLFDGGLTRVIQQLIQFCSLVSVQPGAGRGGGGKGQRTVNELVRNLSQFFLRSLAATRGQNQKRDYAYHPIRH